jgi:hypothetical protein
MTTKPIRFNPFISKITTVDQRNIVITLFSNVTLALALLSGVATIIFGVFLSDYEVFEVPAWFLAGISGLIMLLPWYFIGKKKSIIACYIFIPLFLLNMIGSGSAASFNLILVWLTVRIIKSRNIK